MISFRFSFLVFVIAFVESAKKITWPFYTNTQGYVVLNSTVGTPGQFVQLQFGARESYDADLEIPSTNAPGGTFNPNASSTFHKTGDNNDPDLGYLGQFGTDTFVIGDGVVEKSEPFSVYDDPEWSEGAIGSLGLGRPDDGIAYKYGDSTNGTLTLGGKPDDCSPNWTRVKEHVFDIESFEQWSVEIDKLSAGKYTFKDPDCPKLLIDQIAEAVGVDNGFNIDCDSKATITFTIGGLDIVMQGKDFISETDESGVCYFTGEEMFGDDNYILPVSVLKDRCFLLDYQKAEVGFADRIKN
ncbi:Aspartyl protease 4 [Aphelenchoides bicaudatus]|nr:Aspartyl protease 4 [Aphelenchoides bicaudatus]